MRSGYKLSTVPAPKPVLPALVLLVALVSTVNGAGTITLVSRNSVSNPGLTISNSFGYLNNTGSQVFDSGPFDQTNGTITFDVSSQYAVQIRYVFTVKSYGNGTLTVRFVGPVPTLVTTGGHLSTGLSGAQDVLYAIGDGAYGNTDTLIVSYLGISHTLRDAALVMAMLTPAVIAIGLARWSQDPFDPKRPDKMRKLLWATVILSTSTAVLFILSTLFNA